MIVAKVAGKARATAEATLVDARVIGWVTPSAQLGVAADIPAGPRAAGSAALRLANASNAVAELGGERLIAKENNVCVLQMALRSAAWPRDEKCCTVAFVDNKTHSK